MSADVSSPTPDPSRTVADAANRVRVPVERVTLEELDRRRAEDLQSQRPKTAADPAPTNQVEVLQAMVRELLQVVGNQKQRIQDLEQAMDAMLRSRHRPPPSDPNQPLLFPEQPTPAVDADAPAASDADALTTVVEEQAPPEPKPARKGHGRRSPEELLAKLPVERREHPLTQAELPCPCCSKPRCKIGEQTSQQLEYIPAKLICVQHVRFTYSCSHCPEHIVTAPKPPQPIDRGLAGPGLCALITAGKFDDYVPLYRHELILHRAGLFLARSTLCGWLMALGQLVQPLVQRMKEDIFRSRVVQTDGTSIDVLIEGQPKARTGYFWPYLGDAAHPHVVVDFSLDKRKEHPQTFLADYRGYVQVDAYSAYDGCFIANADGLHPKVEVGCWSHAERYFEAALASAPGLAATGLGFTRALFAIEARAKREHLGESEVLALRQREAVPILEVFEPWLKQLRDQVLPKSPLADALRYVLNQWEALRRYVDTGFLEMDNNATERINKLIARGRVNWLFVGSPRGGETAARLLSLVTSCRRLQMDSFVYLRDVYTRLPGLPVDRLDELLPARWLEAHPEARHPPERQGHGHGDPKPRRRRRSPRPT